MRDDPTASVSPKFITYVCLTSGTLMLALILGRLELLVFVLPIATALAGGLSLTTPPRATATLHVGTERLLEKESLVARIEVVSHVDSITDVVPAISSGLATSREPLETTLFVRAGEPRSIEIPLEAVRWGAQALGPVALRSHARGGLLTVEHVVDVHRLIRVYPVMELMHKQIDPPRTQVFTGNYVSRASGDGLEFSDVREYAPGDSPRRVNWRVTSRSGRLHVDEFHPERNADIVLFLDTFADVGSHTTTSLDLAVRGAATLARHYLMHKDRVGLVAFGGLLGWLTARSGQTHLYRIVDYLIGLEAKTSYARKDIAFLPPRSLPPLALIVAFSPLVDDRALNAFADLHARGYSLVVVDTLPEAQVGRGTSAEDRLAHRAWKLLRAAKRFHLQAIGVPVVSWSGGEGIDSVAALLPDLRRLRAVRRA